MPKVQNEVLEKELKALISEIVEIEEEKITPEANFVEELGMDSMMALEILAALEKKYKIKIPEQELVKIRNLNAAATLVHKYLNLDK